MTTYPQAYVSKCYSTNCTQNCCNHYGLCPSSSNTYTSYISDYGSCYYYYNVGGNIGAIIGGVVGGIIGIIILVLVIILIKRKCYDDQPPRIAPMDNPTITYIHTQPNVVQPYPNQPVYQAGHQNYTFNQPGVSQKPSYPTPTK